MVGRVINNWDGDRFPNATCFIEGIQFNIIILLKVIRIELYAFIEETKVGDTCIV